MSSISVQGEIDDQHRLSAVVPASIPPGPVTVWLNTAQEDEAGEHWSAGVSQQWCDDLSDTRQDIYTLADGEPVDPA
jgi:hypothetical protein